MRLNVGREVVGLILGLESGCGWVGGADLGGELSVRAAGVRAKELGGETSGTKLGTWIRLDGAWGRRGWG